MDSIVDPKDFPASDKCTYLNAANVALMFQGAEKAIIEWQKDLESRYPWVSTGRPSEIPFWINSTE